MKPLLAGMLALLTACGCSSALSTQPRVGRISAADDFAARKAYYEKAKVSAVNSEGYVVNGQTYDESAIKYYFKGFGSREAISKSRSAHGAKVSSVLLSSIPPVVGLVVGAYIGLLSSFNTFDGEAVGRNIGIGAGAGLLIGGLGISLPFGLIQHSKIEPRRQEAAEIFNAHLYYKLRLDNATNPTPPVTPSSQGLPSGVDP